MGRQEKEDLIRALEEIFGPGSNTGRHSFSCP
jgi:hypothetical protein